MILEVRLREAIYIGGRMEDSLDAKKFTLNYADPWLVVELADERVETPRENVRYLKRSQGAVGRRPSAEEGVRPGGQAEAKRPGDPRGALPHDASPEDTSPEPQRRRKRRRKRRKKK